MNYGDIYILPNNVRIVLTVSVPMIGFEPMMLSIDVPPYESGAIDQLSDIGKYFYLVENTVFETVCYSRCKRDDHPSNPIPRYRLGGWSRPSGLLIPNQEIYQLIYT